MKILTKTGLEGDTKLTTLQYRGTDLYANVERPYTFKV